MRARLLTRRFGCLGVRQGAGSGGFAAFQAWSTAEGAAGDLEGRLARKGISVVFISAELEEVLRLSDRLVVMRDRRKIDERPNKDVTVSDVLEIIAGEVRSDA